MRRLIGFVVVMLMLAACTPAAQTSPTAAPAKPAATQAPAKAAATTAPAAKAAATTAPAAKPAVKAPPADYFAGKTITMLINYSAGGPTDIFGRMMVPYLEKYIPGKPRVVVENVGGAGGLIGLNQTYSKMKPDGYGMALFSSPFLSQVIGVEGLQYDAMKFVWLGGAVESQVAVVRETVGIKNGKDLIASKDGKIIAGGLGPQSSKDLAERAFFRGMGIPFKYVTGYPGGSDAKAAFLRGEINYYEESLTNWASSFKPIEAEGKAFSVAQRGITKDGKIIRDPRVPQIPTFSELVVEAKGADALKKQVEFRAMESVTAMAAMLRAMVMPPGTDLGVADVVQKAYEQTFADPEFKAQAEKQVGFMFQFVPRAEAQAEAERIISGAMTDKEVLDYLIKMGMEKN